MTVDIVELIGRTAIAALAGLVFGWAYFATLRQTADLLVRPGRRHVAVVLTFARMLGAVTVLGLAALWGALPLLATFVGFLVARNIAMRRGREIR
jgi:fatty acid desaturase